MEQQKSIVFVTILLTITAGYCDTVTFISPDNLFSSHVTGNFIVFAYDIIKHADTSAWLKLLSFPVFILAVMAGGSIASGATKPYTILLVEGILLTVSGATWIVFSATGIDAQRWSGFFITMCVVFSMGLQNAFGRIYSKETYGPTTMMTGNVTQAALDIGRTLKNGVADAGARISLRHQAIIISGFLAGCLSGAVLGNTIGLSAVLFPGIAVLIYAIGTRVKAS